jgi:hypothetical protein
VVCGPSDYASVCMCHVCGPRLHELPVAPSLFAHGVCELNTAVRCHSRAAHWRFNLEYKGARVPMRYASAGGMMKACERQ